MRNDEFNKIEITNEKQVRGVEFGKTQKFEFTHQKDNKLPEGELNEKYVGKTIKKTTEVNVEYMNKASAPVHGTTTVVTSSASASSAATAVTTVATAASVVAVAAVAVGTGISVALHDYDYQFKSFIVSSNSLEYELYIVDYKNERPDGEEYEHFEDDYVAEDSTNEESDNQFTLRVYNTSYDYSVPANLDTNIGSFTNLKPNEKYHIVLSENRFGGETIFDEVFTTKNEEISEVRRVEWDKKCNFLTNVMTVKLDYVDEKNLFSDFKFNLESEMVTATGPLKLTYDLVKTTDSQEIKLDQYPEFNLSLMYQYSFTYVDGGEEKTIDSGKLQFEDNSGAESKFNKFIFDKTANFKNRTFDVQLDFVDDFNVYSDFVLTFYYIFEEPLASDHPDRFGMDIPLEKTTQVQTIDLDGIEISLTESYDYELTCLYYDEKITLDEGSVTFTDNSGAVVKFNELIFNETVNFDTRTFEVQLDYVDELDFLYGFEFILVDLETSEQRVYYLLNTTDVQTITVDEIKEYDEDENPVYYLDVVKHRMKYSFKYWNMDEEHYVVEDKEFKFTNSLVSTFTGVESPYDFVYDEYFDDYLVPMKFIFDDAAHIYSFFEVKLFKDEELYGRLLSSNESNFDRWGYFGFGGMEGHEIDDVIGTDLTMVISALVPSENQQDREYVEVYSDTVRFTKEEVNEIHYVDFDDADEPGQITAGQYEVMFRPYFTGDRLRFEDTYLTFEFQSGRALQLYFNMGVANQFVAEALRGGTYYVKATNEGLDMEDFEEYFMEDFGNPVKIILHYDTNHEVFVSDNNGSGPIYETVSDNNPRNIVLFESYQFNIQV